MESEKEADTKERLFMAAVMLFAERGYKAATVRDICRAAGGANVNAVNYYFGGKEKLYGRILELMFTEVEKRFLEGEAKRSDVGTPEERVKGVIRAYVGMLYGGGEVATAFCRIYTREVVSPTPLLDEVAERFVVPQTRAMLGLMGEALGPDVPEERARDCLASLVGQVTYYACHGPVFARVFPEHPGMEADWERIADHICTFTLAGVRAVQREFSTKEAS